MGKKTITVKELEKLIGILQEYVVTNDRELLKQNQDLILLAKDADYGAKTQQEFEKKVEFDEKTHGVGRMLMFLLNYYGEEYLNKGQLTILDDDPKVYSSSHLNTYRLELKDPDTHNNFGDYAPTADDKPYDFNSIFLKQFTKYQDDKIVDTTKTAWDSFQKAYTTPIRTFDFKSAFWKDGHEHEVNYILQIDYKLKLHVINRITKEEKQFDFIPAKGHEGFLQKYGSLLNEMWRGSGQLVEYAWSNFILSDTNSAKK